MFKVGDKVETKDFGVGEIIRLSNGANTVSSNDENVYHVKVKNAYVNVYEKNLEPYQSPHEKLTALGYKLVLKDTEDYDETLITYKKQRMTLEIDKNKKRYVLFDGSMYSAVYTDLELSRILTRYLEEIEE